MKLHRFGFLVLIAAVAASGNAQGGSAPWPLERQDRWGTARAPIGPPESEVTTPWVYTRLMTTALVSHGASLGPDNVGYFGNWQGQQVFKFNYNTGAILGAFDALDFVRSTPAIGTGGQVFASTGQEGYEGGRVFAIDTLIMDYDWFKDTGYLGGSPTLGPDGDVVMSTGSGKVFRWKGATGVQVWQVTGLGNARSTVVFSRDDTSVFVAHGNTITCIAYSNGRPLWSRNLGSPAGSPGVAPDGTVILGSESGLIRALDPADGSVDWTWQALDSVRGAPAFSDDGVAYVCSHDDKLYAFNVSDGERLWSFTSTGSITTPPSVDALGRIYFHNQAKDIFCIAPTGHEVWRAHMNAMTRGPMTIGPDNTLYVGCSDGLDGLAIIKQHALTTEPHAISVERGVVQQGGLQEILSSDNTYLRIGPGPVLISTQSPIQVVIPMLAPRPDVESFILKLESGSTSQSIRQQVEAFNYVTNAYEVIDTRQTTIPDNLTEVSISFNASRFVQPASGLMRFRLQYKLTAPILVYPWSMRIDLLGASVVPKFIP